MATASVTNTLVNGSTPDASIWNTNYSDLVTFLNTQVVHRDGSKAMTGTLDVADFGIDNAGYVDQTRLFTTTSATITTTPQNLLQLGLASVGGASGQGWEFHWGGYIEASVSDDGSWTLRLRSGVNTEYGQPQKVFSTYHSGAPTGNGGSFSGSCFVTIDDPTVQISLTGSTVSGGTQLAQGLYIMAKRLT